MKIDWIFLPKIFYSSKQKAIISKPNLKLMPFLISFSGLDGSGKTQLIVLMRRFFKRQGISYTQIHFVNDSLENRIAKKLLGDKKVADLSEKRNRRAEEKKISFLAYWVRLFFLCLYACNLKIRLFKLRKRYGVVIFDRYIYDRIAQLAYLRRKRDLKFEKRLVRFFPRPNLPFFLHVLPEQSLERKKELREEAQGIEYLKMKYEIFDQERDSWGLLVIDNSVLTVSEAKKKIIALFKKKYLRFKKQEKKKSVR